MINATLDILRSAVLFLLDSLWPSLSRKRKTVPGRMAIVRLDAIGDFVLWLESGRELARHFPDHEITLVANSAWAELGKDLVDWGTILAIDIRRLGRDLPYRIRTLNRLRQMGFEQVINPTYSRNFFLDDAVVRATGAPVRIGWNSDDANLMPWQRSLSDRWYSRLIEPDLPEAPEIVRNGEFVRKLSRRKFHAGPPRLPAVGPDVLPEGLAGVPYFVIAPGAAWSDKRWPPEKFAQVLARLANRTGWTPALVGTGEDRALCETILLAGGYGGINLSGRTSLAELTRVLRSARLLVTNDSGPVHIAAAVGTPSVCILGGGHFGRFLPYPKFPGNGHVIPKVVYRRMDCFGCNWKCRIRQSASGPTPCVSEITVDEVLGAIDGILADKGAASRPAGDSIASGISRVE